MSFETSVKDLTGIKYFTSLERLSLSYQSVTSLDLSGCTSLNNLVCDDGKLTSLDVSGCTGLVALSCYRNQLTSLDLSKNNNLNNVYLGEENVRQTLQREVPGDGSWSFDLATLVPNLNNMKNVQVTDATLASDGRTVTWADGTVRPVVTYAYETGYSGKNLPVTLTLIPVGKPAATAQEETKAPVVTSPAVPQQVAGQVGQWVTFTVTATDGQAYQWYLDRQDGQGMQPLAGATGASYSTQPLGADWNGYAYYCKVTSTAGSVISPAFVLALPQPTPAPAAGTGGSGSSAATPKPAATAKPTPSPSATAAPEATATAEPSAAPQPTAAPETTTAPTVNREESASFPWAIALGAAGVVLVIGVILVVRRSRQE